jgi:SAM-dependent methyltransferase
MIMDEKFWDEMHSNHGGGWSGNPNPVLVQQVAELEPGRALDIGCGQGDDARWLASKGWTVTASDISSVALARAAERAEGTGDITFVHADYLAEAPAVAAFDLVTLHYFAIPKANPAAARAIADAVAPGGTLLVVNHDVGADQEWNGIKPSDFFEPHGIAELLDESWTVEIDETRPRTTAPPEGAHHTHDTVLRARRLHRAPA